MYSALYLLQIFFTFWNFFALIMISKKKKIIESQKKKLGKKIATLEINHGILNL